MAITCILTGDHIIRILSPFKIYDKTNNLELYLTMNPSYFEDKKFKSQKKLKPKLGNKKKQKKVKKTKIQQLLKKKLNIRLLLFREELEPLELISLSK